MAERGSRIAGSDGDGPEEPMVRRRRMVALRPTSGPPAAASWGRSGAEPVVPGWASGGDRSPATGGWPAVGASSASSLAESVFPFGTELPYEPDAEAAAFLNAPRRPLGFYVAPFGTPPFGNPPTGGSRSVFGGPLEGGSARSVHRLERPEWGPAYPAGA